MRKDRLKAMIEKRGHNPQSLSEMTGISERTIWRIMAEGKGTTDETILALAQALEVSSDYLLGISDDPTPYMKIDNLTEIEKRVLAALRRGDDKGAIVIIASR